MKTIINDLPDTSISDEKLNEANEILALFREKFPNLSGFSGDCFAAAYAINKCLLNGQANIIGCVNKAIFQNIGEHIGHVALHCFSDDEGMGFLDIEGFKEPENIESWAMLDIDDIDYQNLFLDNDIELSDDNFSDAIWINYLNENIELLCDEIILEKYENALNMTKESYLLNKPKTTLKIK